jgi:hypothetical protein
MGSQYSIIEWSKMGQNQPQKIYKKEASVTQAIIPVKTPWWICC